MFRCNTNQTSAAPRALFRHERPLNPATYHRNNSLCGWNNPVDVRKGRKKWTLRRTNAPACPSQEPPEKLLNFKQRVKVHGACVCDVIVVQNPPKMNEGDLEKLAVEELLREAKRGRERAKDMGPAGWDKCPVPPANKRFLINTLASQLSDKKRQQRSERKKIHQSETCRREV
ncbi:hypothetical protein Bbelb_222760 [Branchiostoma belcheri]|nr:hypothetical protein Bbelb_222760 [Branchiostoma belcheri]